MRVGAANAQREHRVRARRALVHERRRNCSAPQRAMIRLLEPVRPVPLGGFPDTPSSETER